MDNFDDYYKIYIIESPSSEDLSVGRNEGTPLSSIFKLLCIPFTNYLIKNKNDFKSVLGLIKEDMIEVHYEEKRESFFLPFIHFSCHGNEDCIAFSDGELINWTELNQIINEVNINLAFDEDDTINPLTLSMSSCSGLHAIFADKVAGSIEKSPFSFIVGHENAINWDDALIAFATYYHNLINKGLTMSDSVVCMNNSINSPDFFKIFHSQDFYDMVIQKKNKI